MGMVTIGSGLFISPDGYAVTNSHIVEGSDTAEIRTSDNKTYPAKVVGRDSLSDIALIKVDGRTDFSHVTLADQPPRAGDWCSPPVMRSGSEALSRPALFRRANVISRPVPRRISSRSMRRSTRAIPVVRAFTQAAKSSASTAIIFSPSGGSVGVAFAIPAETAKAVIAQLKDKGMVTRGWMGVEVQSVTPELTDSLGVNDLHGAIVAGVQDGGPAAKAGLRSGDVITSVNGEPIKNAGELTKKIYATAPGSSIQVAMLRQGKGGGLPDHSKIAGVAIRHS